MSDVAKGFGKALSNPWVIGAGLGLGVLVLLGARNTTVANNSASPAATVLPSYGGASEAYNIAALNQQTANLGIWAGITKAQLGAEADLKTVMVNANKDVSIATIGANVQRDMKLVAFASNISDNAAVVAKQAQVSRQGIAQSVVTSSAAATIDTNQNFARIALANVTVPRDIAIARINGATSQAVASTQANAQIEAARYQYKAVKKASNNSLIGSIVSGISKVAVAAL